MVFSTVVMFKVDFHGGLFHREGPDSFPDRLEAIKKDVVESDGTIDSVLRLRIWLLAFEDHHGELAPVSFAAVRMAPLGIDVVEY